MDLILWRHAEAEDGTPDHARELTAKGIKQAGKVAAFLHQHLPQDHRILVSPATRTQQTVAALLLGCEDATLSIKTGSLWWFSRREGSAQTTLRLVITPDFL